MSDQTVEILVVGTLDIQVATADVVDGLVVDHEAAVGVLKGGVSRKDRVVRLNDRRSNLRSRVDTEFQLALLAIVDGKTLHQESTETRSSTTAEGVEDQETLETGAVVCNTANLVENIIDQLFSNGVVATSVVVGGIFLACDHVLRVEESTVGTGADLIDDIGLKVAVDGAGNVFAVTWGMVRPGGDDAVG